MLTFFGRFLGDRPLAVSSAGIIDVLARVGISEDAVRSTLARMVRRELLVRHKRGRQMYFAVTEHGKRILIDGKNRMSKSVSFDTDWDETWTIVSFSLPNDWRHQRQDLRSQLTWAGFGLLQPGLWIAPGKVTVAEFLSELGLLNFVTVMVGKPETPTDGAEIVNKAFQLDAIASSYRNFLADWDSQKPWNEWPDDLARQLILHTDWLQLVRRNSRLPAIYLPKDWPAFRAEEVFHALSNKFQAQAEAIVNPLLEVI